MASSMGSHAARLAQHEVDRLAARGKGSPSTEQHQPVRWDKSREADDRPIGPDGIVMKLDAHHHESFLESLGRTAGVDQTSQSLLARLDMCEQSKNNALLNRLSGQGGAGAEGKTTATPQEDQAGDISEDEGGVESVTVASDATCGGTEATPRDSHDGPYDDENLSMDHSQVLSTTQSGMDWKNFDAASACGGKVAGSVGTRDEDDDNDEEQSSCWQWCVKIPVLSPTGWFRSYWDWFVISLVLYVAVMVPLQATFLAIMENWDACAYVTQPDGSVTEVTGTWVSLYKGGGWLVLDGFDNFVDMVFIADLVLNFNTGYMDKFGTLVTDRSKIAKNYVRGFFFVDLLSSIPFDKFIPGGNVGAVSILKCIRLLRLGRLMKKLDQMENANAFRVVKLMLGFTLFTHWMACLWFMTGTYGKDPSYSDDVPYISWVWDIRSNFPPCATPIFTVPYWYMLSFYWALTTLTSVGYGDITPLSVAEVWFTILVELLGNVISAVIVGNVAVLLAAYEAAYQRYRDRIETLSAFTQIYEIPKDLAKRMLVSMDHFFQKSQGLEFKGMLSRVSPSLRSEVLMVLFGRSISHTNLFEDAPEPVVKALCAKVDLVEYFTDDYVVRAGDPGTHLYICHTGRVQIIPKGEDPQRARKGRAVLESGALFGEMPVFSGKPHLTHIRCVEPCELLHLSKYDLEDLLVDFPDFMSIFKERVKNKMRYLRHMRTAGQAPPEMLELHGLEAPQFVKPEHGPSRDKDASPSADDSPAISAVPDLNPCDGSDAQELPYFPQPGSGEAESFLHHIIEEGEPPVTPSFAQSPTMQRNHGASRPGGRRTSKSSGP